MKIDVIVPSRARPLQLLSVLTCFDALASGENDITYRVVCDMDDLLTWKMVQQIPYLKVATHIGSGPLSKRMNEAANEGDAEMVTSAADDVFPIVMHWDNVIVAAPEQNHEVFSWQEVNDPNNQTMIVMSRRWLKATGRMLPEYFPFWFGDTWVAEVYELAFQRPMPIIENLQWGGKRGKTKNMRDLAFWFDFFAATRIERIAEARAVCFAWNQPFIANQAMLDDMRKRDAEQLKRVPHYERWFDANKGEPTEQYLSMKAAAEAWLSAQKEAA